jgi:zinc protease
LAGSYPAVLDATLRNGLRVVIVRNTLAPVVSTDLSYLVGSRDDPPDVPGMAHAQEHMLFRGTPNLTSTELETVATALGGSFNAQTTESLTQFQFTIPAANLDSILRIEADRMHDVLDAQSQWQDERGAIEQEVAQDDSTPGNDFFRDAQARAFAGTPYAHDGVGTRAAFDRLTGPRIKAFYKKWYAPNNAVLVIAGDVDPGATLAQVRRRFESIPRRQIPAHAPANFKPLNRTIMRRNSSLIYPLAAVGFRMPGVNSPDFVASYVLQGILDAERGPLRALATDGEALDGEWVAMPYFFEGQLGFATAALNPGADPDAMVSRLQGILNDYAQHGVPRELFETTKRRLVASQELSRNSISQLASDWADTVALDREPTIAHEEEMIGKITLNDVNRVARRYLDVNHAILGALTPSANASSANPPGPAQRGSENPLQAHAAAQLPGWASGLIHNIAVPRTSIIPQRMTLSNGLTLIVVPESISDSVFLYGQVAMSPALQEPQGKEGITTVLNSVFDYGTATMDRPSYQRALDDLDSSASGGTGFGLQSTTRTFERALGLLAANELTPRFDQQTLDVARRRAEADLATTLSGSHSIATRNAEQHLLPPGDPELREPSQPSLDSLTLDDLKAYYAKTFRPDLAAIVVVGNVDPQRTKSEIEAAFGNWHASGAKPELDLPPLPQNAPATVKLALPAMSQDGVTLEQILALRRSDPAYIPLLLGNAVLGGGVAGPEQSRLFRDLRQNAGLVYVVSSHLNVGITRSRFSIQFACAPSNLPRIETIINQDVARMQQVPVGDFELSLTKASIVRRQLVSEASVGEIGGELLGYASSNLPLDQANTDAHRLLETNADAVRSAFATYIKPRNFVRVIEGP